jgi:hypothetical protein
VSVRPFFCIFGIAFYNSAILEHFNLGRLLSVSLNSSLLQRLPSEAFFFVREFVVLSARLTFQEWNASLRNSKDMWSNAWYCK